MFEFFELIASFFWSVLAKLGEVAVTYGNITIKYTAIIFAGILISFVANIFWKGAKA